MAQITLSAGISLSRMRHASNFKLKQLDPRRHTQIRIFKELAPRLASRHVRPRMHRVRSTRCMRGVTRGCRPTWWSQPGSNRRPPACKAGALPAELWPLWSVHRKVVGLGRFELPTSPLSGVRSNQLSYRPGCRPGFRSASQSSKQVT